jgi:hypothetical protein
MTRPFQDLDPPSGSDDNERLVAWFARFSRMAAASQLYERLAREVAQLPEVLAIAAAAPIAQPVPNLLFAAVHDLLLRGVDHALRAYYPSVGGDRAPDDELAATFASFCRGEASAIRTTLMTRSVQTSEVRRCAVLLPAFLTLASEAGTQAIAVLEVGAGAGFNLLWEHYAYDYGGVVQLGPCSAPLTLECELRGEDAAARLGLTRRWPMVVWRRGLDRQPIDLEQEEERRWLEALVWPDQPHRLATLRSAIAVTRAARPPLDLRHGDAIGLADDGTSTIAAITSDVPHDAAFCVVHSYVLNQLSEEGRRVFEERLVDLSRDHAVWRVSLEWLGTPNPELRLERFEGGVRKSAKRLAETNDHGRWLEAVS